MAEPIIRQRPDESININPDTLRIEVYWKGQGQWAMVAEGEPFEGMLEEAVRVFKTMVSRIALSGATDTVKGSNPKAKR